MKKHYKEVSLGEWELSPCGVNWFGRRYYTIQNSTYDRGVWLGFKCFLMWDIWCGMVLRRYYFMDKKKQRLVSRTHWRKYELQQ